MRRFFAALVYGACVVIPATAGSRASLQIASDMVAGDFAESQFEHGVLSTPNVSTKLVTFPDPAGGAISDGSCRLPDGDLVLHADGAATFRERLFSMDGAPIFQFRFEFFDANWTRLTGEAEDTDGDLISLKVPVELESFEDNQMIPFNPSLFSKVAHVAMNFKCQKGLKQVSAD